MKAKWNIVILSLVFFFGFCSLSTENSNNFINKEIEMIEFIKNNAYPINITNTQSNSEDLINIRQIFDNYDIVCLGESRHDIHEQFLFKFKMIKFLVEELNFNTFVLEASFPYSELINNFIKSGEGNIEKIMSEMPGWFLWDTEEMFEIISWMREYNKDCSNEDKLQFYGIDIVSPVYGINKIFEYLKVVDPKNAIVYQNKYYALDIIEDSFWPNSLKGYSNLTQEKKEILKENYESLYKFILQNNNKYITKSSLDNYNWILQLSKNALEANKMFSEKKRLEIGLIRDKAMATNVDWIVSNSEKGSKTIIWAHNVHIAKDSFSMTGEEGNIQGMGYLLNKKYEDKLISIGALFNRGEFVDWGKKNSPSDRNTLDGLFAQVGIETFLFDLRNIDNKILSDYLKQQTMIHGQDFEMICIPRDSFDAIYFIDDISRTMPRKKSLIKFKEMN